ncbi:MAG: (deoxy)nucleoside triphosphate pyrophosphohydrolase [Magnetococcales bacterium]|nr:(deoxy)nucleoside triphosphate pyrophosphohydrolase [Magnetococcales bacterium]MBF0323025.1 (deoxy)nucleoside triphosphate pyrophosphohydrolase [Magnetococcales bacterium]
MCHRRSNQGTLVEKIALKPLLLVCAALLRGAGGRILLTRRRPETHMGSCWEFPGGKLHPGESPEMALVREIREEVGLDIVDPEPWTFVSHPYDDFHLLMPVFSCRQWSGTPQPLEVADLGWFHLEEMARLPFPPADWPLVEKLKAEEIRSASCQKKP